MTERKKSRGRPALPEREKKKNHVTVALTDAEKRGLERAAKRADMTPHAWLRDIVLAAIKKAVKK